jgi:hypothetical protein
MYGFKKSIDINTARFHKFCSTYKAHNANEPFKKELKNYDASNLPPCTAELHQQILRTHVLQAFSKMHIYGSQVVYQWMRLTRWEI